LIGVASLAAAGAAYQALASARDRRRFPPPGDLVDAGGYRLHVRRMGEGGPAVVIQGAGAGASLEWRAIQDELASTTQVCVYDRAGYGWSDPAPDRRTADAIAEELRVLLRAAPIPRPVVLVGHSIGGVFARHYARRFPEDVAGLVLVDSSHEEQLERLPDEDRSLRRQVRALAVARVLARLGILRMAVGLGAVREALGFEKLAPHLQSAARAIALRPQVLDTLHAELSAAEESLARSAVRRPLGDLPLAVLTAGRQVVRRGQSAEDTKQAWRSMQSELVALSTNSQHIIAEESGHYIHEDQPDLVIDAIRWVVEQARQQAGASLAPTE
jgi:pimeloyl-ACP methyl ester carboxylesterase